MNLLSKLHKNSVLTGPINSYCLVCGCLLQSEEESYAHIQEPGHVDKLSSVPILADYNNCIIKIKEGYFCRYCNIILPTIKRVGLHVAESKHGDNKNLQSVVRRGGVILAFDTVVINDRSWNGLDGSTCSVCNEDYDDEEDHKIGTAHVLNLIQAQCEFGETFIYRKVDEDLFFCLICNEILHVLDKPTHHESDEHVTFYEKSKIEAIVIRDQKDPTESINNKLTAIEPNNNTIPANEDNDIQIRDAKDNKPKPLENKAENGSSNDINDNKPTTHKNTHSVAPNAETSKLTALVHSKTEHESQNKDAELNKSVKTSVANDTNSEHVAKVKTTPTPVGNVVNGKAENDLFLPRFYEYLESCNFVVRHNDKTGGYCTLCDIQLDVIDENHYNDKHHSMLYIQHVTRKTNKLAKNGQDLKTVNETCKTNGELKAKETKSTIAKENTTVNQANDKKARQVNDKTDDDTQKATVKISKGTEKNAATVKQTKTQEAPLTNEKQKVESKPETKSVIEQDTLPKKIRPLHHQEAPKEYTVDKENIVPNKDKNESSEDKTRSVLERNQRETEPGPAESATQSKKSAKKAQKKAAKAKIAETETTVLPKKVHETAKAIPGVCGLGTVNAANTECKSLEETTPNVLTNSKAVESVEEVAMEVQITTEADLKTEKLLNILKTVSHIDEPDDVVLNYKYVLGNLSFVLVERVGDKAKCLACDKELRLENVHEHINTDNHRSNVEECLVVTSFEDEFVRQVKTKEYHCGYCNIHLTGLEELKFHFKSYRHNDAKTSAWWRLQCYLPSLKISETREVKSVLTTIFRCTRA